ncbi:MAG TPA: thiamine pyrophosphate-binding protein [Burkholderiales bacterium]|nr:thiamine pyrophosphate-binding protein [Burkholderiales bacterium]
MKEIPGAEAFVRMLQLHGVKHIFGLCGDTSLPFYDALARLDHGMKHILCRDERSAAYMADGYARVSGKVGVCEGPSGGGATYILPGLVEANESSVPVLAITTDISVSSRGRYTLTELDQQGLFRPLTKWNQVLNRPADIPRVVRSAFTHMTTGRPGSAHIGLPFDVQTGTLAESDVWADAELGRYPARRVGPDPAAVARVAALLERAERPIFICGGGVVISGAEPELQALAERLGAPVATTISGQGSLSEEHPLALGVVGSNGGTPQTRAVVQEADLVVFVGCRAGSVTTERWRYPVPGKATIVHIDVDPAVIGANYKVDAALVGDAKLVLSALASSVKKKEGSQAGRVEQAKREKFAAFRELAESTQAPIRPERVVADLQAVLPPDAVIVADPGTPCPYFSAFYVGRKPGRHFISNRAHGALGYSLSGAVGAHFGRPGVKCVSVMGDGSFGFTGGELETVVRHKLPITFVVLANSTYGWIKAGQKSGFGSRFFSVDFDRTDHARVAEAYGLKAWRVEDPAALRGALAAAVAHGGPTLVDVATQPLHEARAPVSEWVA